MDKLGDITYEIATGDRMIFTNVKYVIMQDCSICGDTIGFRFMECNKETFWKHAEDPNFLLSVAEVLNEFGWFIDMDKKSCRCPNCINEPEPTKEIKKAIQRIPTKRIAEEEQPRNYNPFSEF